MIEYGPDDEVEARAKDIQARRKALLVGSGTLSAFLLTLIFIAIVILSPSCGKQEKTAGPPETIRIGAYKGEYAALVWVAESEGSFAKYGLTAEVTGYESGIAAVEALMAGAQDVATAADSVFVSKALALASISDIRLLGAIAKSESIKIVARKDRGITKPVDLKGRKIAFTAKSPAHYFLDRFLLYQHIDPRAVTIVDLPPLKLIEAISQGSVDAAITWEPYAWRIKQNPAVKVNSWPAQSDQQFSFVLICKTEYAEKHAETARKLFRALNDAELLLRTNPPRARRILAQRLSLDERYLASAWGENIFELSLDHALLLALEDQTRWAIAGGLAPAGKPFNYLKSIYHEPLRSVKPEAVTLYR